MAVRCDATSGGGWSRGCSPAQALSPHCHALGPQGDQLPRLRPVGLRRYSAEAVLRRAQRRKLRKKLARRAVASGVSSAMPEETWEATRRLGGIFRNAGRNVGGDPSPRENLPLRAAPLDDFEMCSRARLKISRAPRRIVEGGEPSPRENLPRWRKKRGASRRPERIFRDGGRNVGGEPSGESSARTLDHCGDPHHGAAAPGRDSGSPARSVGRRAWGSLRGRMSHPRRKRAIGVARGARCGGG